jgi:hypothetical protein
MSISMHEYLLKDKESLPKWLADFQPGQELNYQEMLSSRVLYYPGSHYDGQPIETFNRSHHLHVYFYLDYGCNKTDAYKAIFQEGFLGYDRVELREINLWRMLSKPKLAINLTQVQENEQKNFSSPANGGFGYFSIFERKIGFDDEHGAKRFALFFLGYDGITSYDYLFGSKTYNTPHVMLIQDFGFGGNYDKFGNNGLLHKAARMTNSYPKLLLCAQDTEIWNGYTKLENVEYVKGGVKHMARFLWTQKL